MKRLVKNIRMWFLVPLTVAAAGLLSVSCEYDDDDLKKAMEEMNERLVRVEAATRQMQSDLASLQIIVDAVAGQIGIASVLNNEDGSYTILFSDGGRIRIGGPSSGVAQPTISVVEEDGDFFWIYVHPDGSTAYVTDAAGNKIKANGKEGVAPQLRINADNEWEISTDGGKTWTSMGVKAVGEDGDSFFRAVDSTSDPDYIFITLADGTVLKIAKVKELVFLFATEKTQYFTAGEQKTIPVTMSGVAKYLISKPDGWRAVLTGDGMQVTAPPAENAFAERQGIVAVSAVGYDGRSLIAELGVEIGSGVPAVDLSAAETANCYLVGAPGTYRFNATVQGNGAAGSIVDAYTFSDYVAKMSPVSAQVLWMTSPGLVSGVVLDGEHIEFTVGEPFTAGNALVAALDASGEVLWSWHLWLAAFDPDATMQVYDNGFRMMDRNLGAFVNTPGELDAIGLFYQWGRKDPFVGPDKVYTASPGTVNEQNPCRRTVYDAQGNPLNPYTDFPTIRATGDGTIGSVAYATAHPTTFIGGKNASDWYDGTGTTNLDRNNYLWGNPKGHLRKDVRALHTTPVQQGATLYNWTDTIRTRADNTPGEYYSYYYDPADKTKMYSFSSPVTPEYETGIKSIYDPCPPGWRMPHSGMWSGFFGTTPGSEEKAPWAYNTYYDAVKMGRTFRFSGGQTAWYQCTGSLGYGDNKFSNFDNARFWCSDVGNNGSMLAARDADGLYVGYYYKYTADGQGANAAYPYFSKSTFAARMLYNAPISTVDGEAKPMVTNAPKIGAQELNSGAARAFGYNVRCMKAQ